MSTRRAPGLAVTRYEPPPAPAPLRTDVAAILGRTRRGRPAEALRVEGWRGFLSELGGLAAGAYTPYAARGYFDNGGLAAHVVRVVGKGSKAAKDVWDVADAPAAAGFAAARYRVEATSPGAWADDTLVTFRYRAAGTAGTPEIDVRIEPRDEPAERFTRVAPAALVAALAASRYVRLTPLGDPPAGLAPGPQAKIWTVRLRGGTDVPPVLTDYLAAADVLPDVAEPALIALPDLHVDLTDPAEAALVLTTLVDAAAGARDRLVLIDLPGDRLAAASAAGWLDELRAGWDPRRRRAAAAYHPWLRIRDPLGGTARPVLPLPSSGHVAGVISRLDRERGAYASPANAWIYDAVDVTAGYPAEDDRVTLNEAGVNLLRCAPGGGLQVWGARTADLDFDGRFVAHRRLVHRVVRAIRAVAEPLVFEGNGPELQLTFVRAVTTVLLEAYEAGGLAGARPEEAFRVHCDEHNNPAAERDLGRIVCDIEIAPATPMEFIELRLALVAGGVLEVVEA